MTDKDFKNEIKSGFDKIKPDSEFRTRIINREFKRKKRILHIRTAGFCTMSAAAAAIILIVVLHNPVSEQMITPHKNTVSDNSVSTEEIIAEENTDGSKQEASISATDKKSSALSNGSKSEGIKHNNSISQNAQSKERRTVSAPEADEPADQAYTDQDYADAEPFIRDEIGSLADLENIDIRAAAVKSPEPVVSCPKKENSESAPMLAESDEAVESAALTQGTSVPPYKAAMAVLAEYNYNNSNLEYYQSEITEKVKLSADMRYNGSLKYESEEENNKEYRLYNYTGDNGRYVNIVSSKDTEYVDAVITMDEVPKSDVENIPVENSGDNEYFFYMHVEDTGFVVNSKGLEKTENQDLLYSLGGE